MSTSHSKQIILPNKVRYHLYPEQVIISIQILIMLQDEMNQLAQ